MRYRQEDRLEFDKQLRELLKLKIIQESRSPHSSLIFMVRDHAKINRGKAPTIINYKKLNKYTKFGYYYFYN